MTVCYQNKHEKIKIKTNKSEVFLWCVKNNNKEAINAAYVGQIFVYFIIYYNELNFLKRKFLSFLLYYLLKRKYMYIV